MAKSKRAKAVSPRTEDESRGQELHLLPESSEDEAPEEVTFQASRERALRSVKLALETARREKEELKEKRRRRQELFQEQKKRKLFVTSSLPEEEDSVDSEPPKKKKGSNAAEKDESGKPESKKKKQKKSLKHARNLKGNYTVTTMKGSGDSSFQQRVAEDFLRVRLYGAGRCRSTNNAVLSLQNKSGLTKSAAVQFVKKDWAVKHKSKAQKLKKRWIHKQLVESR